MVTQYRLLPSTLVTVWGKRHGENSFGQPSTRGWMGPPISNVPFGRLLNNLAHLTAPWPPQYRWTYVFRSLTFCQFYDKVFYQLMFDSKEIAIVWAGLVGTPLPSDLKNGITLFRFLSAGLICAKAMLAEVARSISRAQQSWHQSAPWSWLADAIEKQPFHARGEWCTLLTASSIFLPYGKKGQFINSISRSRLNMVLLDEAERLGLRFILIVGLSQLI